MTDKKKYIMKTFLSILILATLSYAKDIPEGKNFCTHCHGLGEVYSKTKCHECTNGYKIFIVEKECKCKTCKGTKQVFNGKNFYPCNCDNGKALYKIKQYVKCEACNHTGFEVQTYKCPKCNGMGYK